jgi:SAM-dependent methyltransferase
VACGGTRLTRLPLVYEFGGSFPLVECAGCGLRFLAVQPTGEGLASLYSAEYFQRDFRCGRSAVAYSSEETFRAENQSLLDAFERLGPDPRDARVPRSLLEVGSAGGWLLKHARERGWRVLGVELSAEAVAQARSLGLEVFHGDLLAAALAPAAFDLVYMGDVLEHVPDCRAALVEVARVLRPGGHFLYADYRYNAGLAAWEQALAAAPLALLHSRVINTEVRRGMDRNAPRSEELIARHLPRCMHGIGRDFAGLPGSHIYEAVRRGKLSYRSYCLQKPG